MLHLSALCTYACSLLHVYHTHTPHTYAHIHTKCITIWMQTTHTSMLIGHIGNKHSRNIRCAWHSFSVTEKLYGPHHFYDDCCSWKRCNTASQYIAFGGGYTLLFGKIQSFGMQATRSAQSNVFSFASIPDVCYIQTHTYYTYAPRDRDTHDKCRR